MLSKFSASKDERGVISPIVMLVMFSAAAIGFGVAQNLVFQVRFTTDEELPPIISYAAHRPPWIENCPGGQPILHVPLPDTEADLTFRPDLSTGMALPGDFFTTVPFLDGWNTTSPVEVDLPARLDESLYHIDFNRDGDTDDTGITSMLLASPDSRMLKTDIARSDTASSQGSPLLITNHDGHSFWSITPTWMDDAKQFFLHGGILGVGLLGSEMVVYVNYARGCWTAILHTSSNTPGRIPDR